MTFFRLALGAAKRRKTPREKKKYITPREKTKNKSFKWRFSHGVFRLSSSFFVFSRGRFRYSVFWPGVISSLRCFAWRYFVFLRGVFRRLPSVISSFRRAITPAEKTKWHKSATIETTSLFNSEDHEIPEVVRSNPVRTIPKV